MKRMYVDIGELGWSLYLSAHMRWLKENMGDHIAVMTFSDRKCLYERLADSVYEIPNDFHGQFNRELAIYFGLRGATEKELRDYFLAHNPNGYKLEGPFGRWKGFRGKITFKPYAYGKRLNGNGEILIFPRYREGKKFNGRNLPEEFYAKLIGILCDKFPDYITRAIGIPSGAYSISGIKKSNYINDVRKGADLQELIDRCQVAVAAVGSQSAPPKITLLQGVPTFMIGHQRERHINSDNWMSTKVEFYDVSKRNYASIDIEDCINRIITFTEECQHA